MATWLEYPQGGDTGRMGYVNLDLVQVIVLESDSWGHYFDIYFPDPLHQEKPLRIYEQHHADLYEKVARYLQDHEC